jgi:hypothetical protein
MVLLALMAVARVAHYFIEDAPAHIWALPAFGPAVVGLVILGCWLALSRASLKERFLGLLSIVGLLVIEQVLCHPSMRGALLMVMTIPMTTGAFALGQVLWGNRLQTSRTWLALGLAGLAASISCMLRTTGAWGDFSFEMFPRWKATSEAEAIARSSFRAPGTISPSELEQPAWPNFRGPKHDSVSRGIVLDDQWLNRPPTELWRIPVGPAWSSFAVAGNYLFTQEQRADDECVVCYDSRDGKEVWHFSQPSRFFEALGGLGPRATPTLSGNSLYALGAEGWLVKLDVTSGKQNWKADLRQLANTPPPMWGFSSSPLVHEDQVIVHAGGSGDKGVLALSTDDASIMWSVACGQQSYGSLQIVRILGQDYLSVLSDQGAHLWQPSSGQTVIEGGHYSWPHSGYRALQPQIIDGDKMLVATGMGVGTRLVQLQAADQGLRASELWTSRDLKSDFNDFVIYQGHAYGFDDKIFTCIDLQDGKRRWKGGRYAKGQAVLVADSGLIVVVSETGDLVLLRATPEGHQELAKIPALDGKTWNHPVIVGDRLFLRNAKEAVCYQLPTK